MGQMREVHEHQCEAFMDLDKDGNRIADTFSIKKYDGQYPGEGVPVANKQLSKKPEVWGTDFFCPFCNKDVKGEPLASEKALKYLEGK